jgi:diguanylate cyclase (GGDEF)-like protein
VAGAAAAVHGAVTRLVAPVTTADAAADRAAAQRAAAERAAAHRRAAARHPINQALGLAAAPARALIQIIEHIPLWLWVALVAALLFAFLTGISALLTARRARRQESMFAALSAAALTDSLTGVLNRRGFTEAVERELARARRYGHPFVLAYVDVRGLKGVNDTEGHQVGDKLLQEAAGMLQASARADDVVGRLGGDEMALLLVEQTSEAATAVTERLQSEVAARRTELALRAPWALTVGTAAYPADGETFDELLRTADHRLYEQRGIELRSGPAGQPVAG